MTKNKLHIKKVGLISRDYNKVHDFKNSLPDIIKLLDSKGCDALVFALYSIDAKHGYDIIPLLESCKTLRMVVLEFFSSPIEHSDERSVKSCLVYICENGTWHTYPLEQKFSNVDWKNTEEVLSLVEEIPQKRLFGNTCVLICGEVNGVKYNKSTQRINDICGLRKAIPQDTFLVLAPGHDRMTRHEMASKKRFFSLGNRWCISVWNKGRKNIHGKTADGTSPAWTVFYNGIKLSGSIVLEENSHGLEIGIVDTEKLN